MEKLWNLFSGDLYKPWQEDKRKKNPPKQNELIPSLSSPLPDLDPEIY